MKYSVLFFCDTCVFFFFSSCPLSLSHVACLPACLRPSYRPIWAPPSNYRVSALQAFWPAVQAAVGDEETAKTTYDTLFDLWEEYDALPDFYDPLNDR